jgi:hypothetical protein
MFSSDSSSLRPEPTNQPTYVWSRIDPRTNRLIRDKLRKATLKFKKEIDRETKVIRFRNRLNLNKTGVDEQIVGMWAGKIQAHVEMCYDKIYCHHWGLLGHRKTGAFVRVCSAILGGYLDRLGGTEAHEARIAHRRQGGVRPSVEGLYKSSAGSLRKELEEQLDIEARELDLVAVSRKTLRAPAHPVLRDWIINQRLHELEGAYQNDQKNKPPEIEFSSSASPRVAAISYTSDRLKQHVADIKGVYRAEIESGRFANEPGLWVCVYRDKILPFVLASRTALVGSHALRVMRTGGGKPGETEAVQQLKLDLDKFVAQLERELAAALEHLEQPRQAETFQPGPAMPQICAVVPLPSAEQQRRRKSFVFPLLDKKGWSINDWAVQSEVDFHTADRYLKGKSKPYPSTRRKLAKSLGLTATDLPS